MKRTFSTTFFRRALFLVLLFGGVTNLWGEDKSLPNDGTLSFAWSSRANGTFLGGATSSDGKCISDGLWEWNRKGEDEVKMVNNYCIFKGKATYNAQTRDRYHFDAGTYVFTFYYYFDEGGCEYYEPEVSLSADQRHNEIIQPSAEYLTNTQTGAYTKHVFVSVPATGYYYIRLITGLNNSKDERFGYWKVNIAEPCHAVLFEAEDQTAWLNINQGDIIPQDGYELKHDDGATPYGTKNKNYMELPNQGYDGNQRLCYAFEITTATAGTLIIRSRTTVGWNMDDNAKFDIWSTSMDGEGSLTWVNDTYTKSHKDVSYPVKNNMWSEASVSLGNLSVGKYILAMHKSYHKMDYDYFIIQTDKEALCVASEFNVTFNMQGHGTAPSTQVVAKGGKVTRPSNPSASGYSFGGWYKEQACSNAWDFTNDVVNANTTLYAKWTEVTTKTIYMKAGDWKNDSPNFFVHSWGSSDSDVKMELADCETDVYKAEIPKNNTSLVFTRQGKADGIDWNYSDCNGTLWNKSADIAISSNNLFTFNNWSDGGDDWQCDKKHSKSTFTSGTYTIPTRTITYQSGTGSDESDQVENVNCGDDHIVIVNPFTAKSINYEFTGWKENSTDHAPGDELSNVTTNHTLVAQWDYTPSYTITVESANSSMGTVSDNSGTYLQGTQIEISATPNDGYGFYQWNDGNTNNPRTITVTGDATYTASFKAMVCTNTFTLPCGDESLVINSLKEGKAPVVNGTLNNGQNAPSTSADYICLPDDNQDKKVFYQGFEISKSTSGTITIKHASYENYAPAKITLYRTGGSGDKVTYNDEDYFKCVEYAAPYLKSGNAWETITSSNQTLNAGKYLIALQSTNWKGVWVEYVTINTDDNVFCTEAPAVTTWSVFGNFDGDWKDYEMTDGVVTIPNLGRNANYKFKLRKTSDEGIKYTYYGAQNKVNNMTSSNCTNWTLTNTNDGYDINITTGATGSYTFTATDLTGDSPKLSVTYPTAYSITFDDNDADGGTDMTNITNIASGGSETLPTMTRTKTGYRFTGWKDASSNDYADGATIENITSNITLTAQWETVVTIVTVTAEGGVDEIMVGNTLQMSVAYTPSDAAYGRSVTWSSSNTNLATISNEGLVSALQPGSVTITATSLNGVQGNYPLTIVASACGEGVWKMTYWPQGSGNKSEYCFTQIGETHEWRRDYTLPNVADWFSIGQVGGANDHSKDWTFNALTTIGLQSNSDATNYYPGQDAVGYLRIFDNSEDENYYVAFEPIYQALFGIDGGSDPWTVLDFEKVANTDHGYETSTFQVPAGYKTNNSYKYYVGTKRANRTPQFVSGKSRTDILNTVGGLKDSDMSGKYGKFHIWGNSPDNNWYCEFKRYYRLAYSGEGTEEYNPHDVYSDGSSSDRTVTLGNVPAKTGYNISGWTIGGELHTQGTSYEIIDDATAIATWTPITYNITYTDAGTHANPATYTIENTPIVLQNPEKDGYTFVNWTIGDDVVTEIAAGTTGDITLIAHWTPTEYHINYTNLGGAENTNPNTYTIESETITFVAPGTRTGYTFGAWDPTSIAHGSTGNKTIAASWNLVNYAITYHDAGTHSNPTSYTITSSDIILSAPSARTGYEFGGWYIDESLQTPITTISTGSHENKDIYAKWTANQYTITLDANGGSANGQVKVTYNSNTTTEFSAPTRDNYIIEGFYAENGCTTKVMNADGTLCTSVENYTDASGNWVKDEACTLYTKWAVDYCSNTFTIQCEENRIEPTGGTGKPSNLLIIEDDGDMYYINAHSNDGVHYYVDLKNSTGEIYYFVHLPAATYNFDVYLVNSWSTKVRLYSPNGTGSKTIQWNSTSYKQVNTEDNWEVSNKATGEHASFAKSTISNKTLEDGDYIISLRTDDSWAAFDQIVITADKNVFCPEMYTVNFAASPLGMGTVTAQIKNGATITSGTEVPENTVVVFTASNIASGYEVVNWTDGSGNELAGAVNSFEQKITSDTSVTANIALIQPKYTVTATAGEHGTITSGADEYREGATVTIVTAPDANYKVGSATASNVSEFTIDGNNVSFTMPAAAVAVTINFVFDTVHALIITPNSDETYTFGEKDGYASKFDISSVADPTSTFGHNVLKLEYDGMTDNYAGRSISKDAGYTPNPKATGFALWYRTEKSDDGIAFCFQKTNGNQTKWQMQATNGEWRYYYWEDNAAANYATNANFMIYMNGDDDGHTTKYNSGTYYITEIQATNVTSQEPIVPPVDLTVVVSPNEGGSVTTYPETTTGLEKGTEVELTATPNTGYRFANWTVGGTPVSTDATYKRTVNATETITANFVRVYTLIVGHDTNIASVAGAGQYAEGESVTVTATADQGYKFTKWTAGAGGSELATTSSYTFEMPATDNYTVYANSEVDITYYQITLGPCTNGTIAATVNGKPYTGGDLTANTPVVLTATPNEGYGFVQWIDGSREKTHTIYANAETQAITWTAEFAVRHTVTATYGKPGTEVTGQGEYATGAQVTLEAFVSDKDYELDYNFSHWEQVSGTAPITEHEHDNPLTFIMPAQNLTLKAIYAPVECVDTFVIQCEDDQAYIPYNTQGSDLTTYPHEIPHVDGCGRHSDYYTKYHGTGYYDYREAESAEMYYPIDLPASTYKFEMWSATNDDKDCWMNLYIESDDANPDVVYKEVSYKKTDKVKADNYGADRWPFAISGTIENVVITSPKSVIIGLYCGHNFGAFDQIKITATDNGEPNYVFCHELSTDLFVIKEGETKEIPVCGVKNLIIYDGGQANNEEDVEASVSIKHVRQVKKLDIWEDFAVPYTATSIQVEDPDDHNMYDIYPAVLNYSGDIENGYFYMQELKHEEMATVTGIEFRQRWQNTTKEKPQANIPYIIEFTSTQSDGYFQNTYITYGKTGSTEVRGYENATVDHGSWPTDGSKPTYHYVANNSVVPVYPYDAYVLNDDHTEFVLTDHPEILPFHCYIQASAETKVMAPRLRLVGGGSTPTLIPVVEALNVDAEGVFKFIMDDKVYILRNGVLYNAVGQHVK